MKKNKFLVLILTAGLLFAIHITGCKKPEKKAEQQDNPETTITKKIQEVETIFAVNTTIAVEGEINNYIELSGDIKTKTEVDVYPDAMGKLHSITVNVGQTVRKNEVIAYVDPSKPGMVFALSPVKSPISGTITSIPIKIGATVTQQIGIAKVGKLDELEIITNVAEKFISKMKKGLIAIVKADAYPGKNFYATVTEVSPVVDPLTRMLEVKLQLNENTNELKPGMFAEIKIITEKKEDIVKIPSEAMIKRYGAHYIFVIHEKLPEKISKEDFVDFILANLEDKADRDFIKTVYRPANEKDLNIPDPSKKNKKADSSSDDTIYKKVKILFLKDAVSEDEKAKIIEVFTKINYGFFIVEQRKISPGIQIDNKLEVVEGLKPNEEIVIRGQTLLDEKSRVRIIDRIQPLTKNDVIE